MAVEQNIEFFLGEDIILDDTIRENNAEQTITSWAITFLLALSGTVVLTYTVGSGIVVSTTPIARITIPRSATKSLAAGNYDYEVCRTDTGENVVLTFGKCKLKSRVYPAAS